MEDQVRVQCLPAVANDASRVLPARHDPTQKVAMRALGFDIKKPEVLKILREYEKNGQTGLIDFDDFNKVSTYLSPQHPRPVKSHCTVERKIN